MPRATARKARARVAASHPPRVAPRVAPRGAAVYRALADDTRRGILALLATSPLTAGAIAEAFPAISRPAVSKHLAVLRDAGLVVDHVSGRERTYSLNTTPLADVSAYIAQLDVIWAESLARLGKHLDET